MYSGLMFAPNLLTHPTRYVITPPVPMPAKKCHIPVNSTEAIYDTIQNAENFLSDVITNVTDDDGEMHSSCKS
jgi:hypothetical protein